MTTTKGYALVTGASGGIGAVYADRLARRGHDLILVARNEDRLKAVAAEIAKTTGREIRVVIADLNNPADLRRVEQTARTEPRLEILVNNAGFGSNAKALEVRADEMEEMIGINVTALTRLTYAALPALVGRGHGAIVNIASIVALAPELLNGVYGASKAYVLAFGQSLTHELAGTGVQVQTVLPGVTATGFWDVAGVGGHGNLPAEWVMTAEDLVDAALVGLDRGEAVTIPPLQDEADWTGLDDQRRALAGKLSNTRPAPRYRTA